LLEGEVLLGMKQTRVLNISILVPGLAMLMVPVSCVEMGRWHRVSDAALGKDRLNLSPKVRRAKTGSVMRSARITGRFASDQSAVWAGVASVLNEADVDSPTESYVDYIDERADSILAQFKSIRPADGQAGVLAFVGPAPICMDVFDKPATLSDLWEGLIGSYATDVAPRLYENLVIDPAKLTDASKWLRGLGKSDFAASGTVGLGETITCIGPKAEAAALVYEGRILHLAAFPGHGQQQRASFASPARRRR
jgi:hypothetical protein